MNHCGSKIGETIDFVVEMGKAVLHQKRWNVASVRRLHGIVKHAGTIDEGVETGYVVVGIEHDKIHRLEYFYSQSYWGSPAR